MTPESRFISSGNREVTLKLYNKNLSPVEIQKAILIFQKHFDNFKEEMQEMLNDNNNNYTEHPETGLLYESSGVD